MPLIVVLRSVFSLLSWLVVGASAYLLWTYFHGTEAVTPTGEMTIIHEEVRLWFGLVLAAWSIGAGGLVARAVLGKRGGRPFNPHRGNGINLPAANGDSIYVETHGNALGPTVIFTHGWGLDSTIWQYVKEDFGDFRLVFWDLPGLGKSKAARPVTLNRLAEGLEAVMTWAGAGPCVLVGHSIGGMTVQTLVRNRPFAVQNACGLVLINTTYTNPLRTMIFPRSMTTLERPLLRPAMALTKALLPLSWLSGWQSYLSGAAYLANRFGFGAFVTKSQLEAATLMTTRNSPGVQADGNIAMFDWDATNALKGTNLPVLVIGGSLDIVTKPSASAAIAASTQLGHLEIAQGAGHLGFVECEERYHAEIRRFLIRSFSGGELSSSQSFGVES